MSFAWIIAFFAVEKEATSLFDDSQRIEDNVFKK
jgi:hypothetical protein